MNLLYRGASWGLSSHAPSQGPVAHEWLSYDENLSSHLCAGALFIQTCWLDESSITMCLCFILFLKFLFFKIYLVYFYFLTPLWDTWILVSQPGIKPVSPALEAWSFNYWTARKIQIFNIWGPHLCVCFRREFSCTIHSWPLFIFDQDHQMHGQRSLAGYSPWNCKESDRTEQLTLLPNAWSSNSVSPRL